MNGPVNQQFATFETNVKGHDYAVGDIHGGFEFLEAALKKMGFNRAVDRLFSLGDLVDRGPQSHQVLEWLAHPWFHAICGNHDFMAWRSALDQPYLPVTHANHGGEWLAALPKTQQIAIGERLRDLPIAAQVHTPDGLVGLVHADCPFDDWHHMQQPLSRRNIDSCLWSVERHSHQYNGIVKGVRAVIQGHLTLRSPKKMGNVYYIDTNGWLANQGHFTFLDLHTLKAQSVASGVFIPSRYR
jgi:serine/threonine protein phosphatase 1